jgi:hypothetical protein
MRLRLERSSQKGMICFTSKEASFDCRSVNMSNFATRSMLFYVEEAVVITTAVQRFLTRLR